MCSVSELKDNPKTSAGPECSSSIIVKEQLAEIYFAHLTTLAASPVQDANYYHFLPFIPAHQL